MTKKLALILALIIALGTVFFAGCTEDDGTGRKSSKKNKEESSESDSNYELEDIVEGEWEFDVSLDEFFKEEAENDEELAEMLEYCDFSKVKMAMELKMSDGEYELNFDGEKTASQMKKPFIEGLKKYYKEASGEAPDDDTIAGLEEVVEQAIDEMIGELEDKSSEGFYRVDGEKIYFADDEDELEDAEEYMKCTVQGKKKIKVTKWESDSEIPEGILPFVMKKK